MLKKLRSSSEREGRIYKIDVNFIRPNPDQPRRVFERRAMQELADSIKVYGVIQPLTVRRISSNEFELVSGERRLQASRMAGQKTVPCIITDIDGEDSAMIALVENIQRQDLSFFEEAYAMERLITKHGLTQEQIAKRLGKNQSTVANKLRVLKLSPDIKCAIVSKNLTERHARALLRLPDEVMRREAISEIIEKGLGVVQAEELIEQKLNHMNSQGNEPFKSKKPVGLFRDARIFINTINGAVDTMKRSGMLIHSKRREDADTIEYSIKIQKNRAAG